MTLMFHELEPCRILTSSMPHMRFSSSLCCRAHALTQQDPLLCCSGRIEADECRQNISNREWMPKEWRVSTTKCAFERTVVRERFSPYKHFYHLRRVGLGALSEADRARPGLLEHKEKACCLAHRAEDILVFLLRVQEHVDGIIPCVSKSWPRQQ